MRGREGLIECSILVVQEVKQMTRGPGRCGHRIVRPENLKARVGPPTLLLLRPSVERS